MCNRALWFWESAQNSAAIILYLEWARNWPNWEPASPNTLHSPGPEIDWNVDWCRTALRTTARGTSSPLRWSVMTVKPVGSGKVNRVAPRHHLWWKNVKMDIKTSFVDVMSEVQKNSQDISAGIGQFFKNQTHKNFVRNLTSKLARSTLTSPA